MFDRQDVIDRFKIYSVNFRVMMVSENPVPTEGQVLKINNCFFIE